VGLAYGVVAITVMLSFCSLAVDFGRMQLAKSQLQQAAYAAARYAAVGISDNTYISRAQDAANDNFCDGTPVDLLSSDIERGTWSNATFTAGGAAPNAIRIVARRVNARGNALSLIFGRVIGMPNIDVAAESIAVVTISQGDGEYGLVGLDSINISASPQVTIDSYNSTNGTYASTHGSSAKIATNGAMNLNGNVKIYGDAYYRTGTVFNGGASVVAPGTKSVLSSNMTYANPTLPGSYTSMGNLNGSGSGSMTLTSGNYYFTNFNISGSYTVNVVGQVNLYVGGNINISGIINTQGSSPANFKIYTTQASGVNISGTASLYADIYAPNSPVNISGSGNFYGRIIGKSLSVSGSPGFHYDTSLGSGSGVTISTVR
jgi:Flp pilus assembly protein TadG